MASPPKLIAQQDADPPQNEGAQHACPCCGKPSKITGMPMIDAQRFQRLYRKEADEFLYGIH